MDGTTVSNVTSLADLIAQMPSSEDLAWDHAMDISGSVYTRLKELGMTQTELAKKLGVTPGRVTQILKGDPGMTLKTLARLEHALDMRLDEGFMYASRKRSHEYSTELWRCSKAASLWHSKAIKHGIAPEAESWKTGAEKASEAAASNHTHLRLVEDAA